MLFHIVARCSASQNEKRVLFYFLLLTITTTRIRTSSYQGPGISQLLSVSLVTSHPP